MARLNDADSRETRLMIVDSASPGVGRQGARTLGGSIWNDDEPTLREYLGSPHLHVRLAANSVLISDAQ